MRKVKLPDTMTYAALVASLTRNPKQWVGRITHTGGADPTKDSFCVAKTREAVDRWIEHERS